jgi:hypothetical protein
MHGWLCLTRHAYPTPHSAHENVMVRTRKGFVRVAVEEGIDGGIVPIYHMGNSLVLDFFPQYFSTLSRRLRAALGFLYGRFGLPLPRPLPIYMVTGKAIPVKKMAKVGGCAGGCPRSEVPLPGKQRPN